MMLLALPKQPDIGGFQQQSRDDIRDDLLEITLQDCNKTKAVNPRKSLDNVPIMRCAFVLQALASEGLALTHAALACFYRIVLELSEIVSPTWSSGTARANTNALASAFITGECARALGALEHAMLRTAEAVELIGQEEKRIAEARSEVPAWREQEEAFRATALYASLTALWPQLAIEFPDGRLGELRNLLARNRANIVAEFESFVRGLVFDLSNPLGVTSAASILGGVARPSPVSANEPVATIVAKQLEVAGQNTAELVLTKLVESLTKDEPPPGFVGPPRIETCERVTRNLRAGAEIVHDLVEPIGRFAESVIDRELARPQLGLTVDGAELVFAACLHGRLSGWQQPKVVSAFRLARQLLTADGRLPSVQPFNIQGEGYRLNVAVLEVTRRMAELAARVDLGLDSAFVKTLIRPFEDTRAPGQEGTVRGWIVDPRGREPMSEWWVTALAADALNALIAMLDAEINRQVLAQFHVRRPVEIDLNLAQLFYADHGLITLRRNRAGWDRSIAEKLQELRIHSGRGPRDDPARFSLVLYGPPGTGKTTLVEATAKSADVPLVEITPSDILVGGEEAIERRTRHVFLALSMLTNVVILFDEFDPILQSRSKRKSNEAPSSIFEFLTPGMLPKLKRLHESAKSNRVSYVLATNFVYNLDPAVIRQGRFDDRHGIYPSDPVSRLGRLLDQQQRQRRPELNLDRPEKIDRALRAVCETAGGAMDQLAKPGWYSAKRFPGGFPTKSLFHYIEAGISMDKVRQEAKFKEQWPEFVEQRTGSANTPNEIRELVTNKTADQIRGLIKNPTFRLFISDQERIYWDDWSAISDWDEDLHSELNRAGATSTLESIGSWLTQWIEARVVQDAALSPAT